MIPITITQTLREGKLVNTGMYDKVKMDTFLEGLKEGDSVECTFEIKHHDSSYAQMSKLHACIRAIAAETGSEFEEMKLVLKQRCGLVVGTKIISFADCSKEQLSKCIEECLVLGDLVNCNLR